MIVCYRFSFRGNVGKTHSRKAQEWSLSEGDLPIPRQQGCIDHRLAMSQQKQCSGLRQTEAHNSRRSEERRRPPCIRGRISEPHRVDTSNSVSLPAGDRYPTKLTWCFTSATFVLTKRKTYDTAQVRSELEHKFESQLDIESHRRLSHFGKTSSWWHSSKLWMDRKHSEGLPTSWEPRVGEVGPHQKASSRGAVS